MKKKSSPEDAIIHIFTPMKSVPTEQGDKTVTTSSGVLFNDVAVPTGHGSRRLRIYNTDASATVGLFFLDAGATATGLSISNATKLGPGMVYEGVIGTNIRVAAVSSAGSVTVNTLVHDLL